MPTREEVRVLVKRVLEESAFSMRQIAEITGYSYLAVRRWHIGERVPTRDSLLRLADAFETHSERLRRLADELRRTANDA